MATIASWFCGLCGQQCRSYPWRIGDGSFCDGCKNEAQSQQYRLTADSDPFLSWLYAKSSDDEADDEADIFAQSHALEIRSVKRSGISGSGLDLKSKFGQQNTDQLSVVHHPSSGNLKERQELVLLACRSGMSINKTAVFAQVSPVTAYKWLKKYRGAALCVCGRSSGHFGWCAHRLSQSIHGERVIDRLRLMSADPEITRKRILGNKTSEARRRHSESMKSAWTNPEFRAHWLKKRAELKVEVPVRKLRVQQGLCACGHTLLHGLRSCEKCRVMNKEKSRRCRERKLQSAVQVCKPMEANL